MGLSFSSGSSSGESSGGTPVLLNVYDLTPLNHYLFWFGLGVFHSGIEVHGLEYAFGAHDFPTSGVFEVEPRSCPGFVYRCSIHLGYINLSPSELQTYMESMAAEYCGDTYHLISKNCNHFTEDICSRLIGKQIPGWINRLARLGGMCNCLLPESLRLPAVKQMAEYHVLSARMDRRTVTMEINARICHHNRQEIEDFCKASHPLLVLGQEQAEEK